MAIEGPDLEKEEWRDSLRSLFAASGRARMHEILDLLHAIAATRLAFPGHLAIEERLASIMRWNALAIPNCLAYDPAFASSR